MASRSAVIFKPYDSGFVSLFIVVGGFGGIAAWIIGPSKGLLVATLSPSPRGAGMYATDGAGTKCPCQKERRRNNEPEFDGSHDKPFRKSD